MRKFLILNLWFIFLLVTTFSESNEPMNIFLYAWARILELIFFDREIYNVPHGQT